MGQRGMLLTYGGNWRNNIYEGGMQEYVPLPHGCISYDELLKKVIRHVRIDTNLYCHQIEALVHNPFAEKTRMKITDDEELNYLFGLFDTPILYINVAFRIDGSSQPRGFMELLNAQNALLHATPQHVINNNSSLSSIGLDNINVDRDVILEDVENGANIGDDVSDNGSGDKNDSLDGNNMYICCARDRHILPSMDTLDVDGCPSKDICFDEHEHGQQWIIPGALYQTSIPCDEVFYSNDYSCDTLSKNATFSEKKKLKIALGLYHLANRVEYIVDRSSRLDFRLFANITKRSSVLL